MVACNPSKVKETVRVRYAAQIINKSSKGKNRDGVKIFEKLNISFNKVSLQSVL